MSADTKLKVASMRVDGGAAANDLMLELQASFSELEVIRPQVIETTAYGAALAAAMGAGEVDLASIDKLWREDKIFKPVASQLDYTRAKTKLWRQTIKNLYL